MFRCQYWKDDDYKCPVKLRMTGGKFYCKGKHKHLCEDEEELKKIEFRARCKSLAASEAGRPKHLFEAARREYFLTLNNV